MGYLLNVIIDISEDSWFNYIADYSIEEAHAEMINDELWKYLKGRIDYFSYMDPNNESFFGKNNPEKLKKIASVWNEEINEDLKRAFDNVASEAAEAGKTPGEWACLNPDSSFLWNLRGALDDVGGIWTFGCDKLFLSKDGDYSIKILNVKDVLDHPDRYVYLQIIYH